MEGLLVLVGLQRLSSASCSSGTVFSNTAAEADEKVKSHGEGKGRGRRTRRGEGGGEVQDSSEDVEVSLPRLGQQPGLTCLSPTLTGRRAPR